MLTGKTDEQILEELNKQPSAIAKAEYWNSHLGLDYLEHSGSDFHGERIIAKFRFRVHSEEREEFCLWLLQKLKEKKEGFFVDELLELSVLIESFEEKLSASQEPKVIIQRELRGIDEYFKPTKVVGVGPILSKKANVHTAYNGVNYRADFATYQAYKEYRLEIDWQEVEPRPFSVLLAANGYTLAKYREYLLQQLEELNNPQSKSSNISFDQRLLLLHYLGALDKVRQAENASKIALFLSQLIRTDRETIRQRFSSILDLFEPKEKAKREKLKKDLQEVAKAFEELGLKSIVKKVQADLRKLGQ